MTTPTRPRKRLTLNSSQGMIAGVCAGLADYLGVDVDWIRIGAVLAAIFFTKVVLAAYLVAWLVLDER